MANFYSFARQQRPPLKKPHVSSHLRAASAVAFFFKPTILLFSQKVFRPASVRENEVSLFAIILSIEEPEIFLNKVKHIRCTATYEKNDY